MRHASHFYIESDLPEHSTSMVDIYIVARDKWLTDLLCLCPTVALAQSDAVIRPFISLSVLFTRWRYACIAVSSAFHLRQHGMLCVHRDAISRGISFCCAIPCVLMGCCFCCEIMLELTSS